MPQSSAGSDCSTLLDNHGDAAPRNQGADDADKVSKSRYGTSCTGCRRRKQRCDGKVPKCSRCQRLKEKCVYENNARNLVPPQSVPLLLQTFQFLHTLTDPTAGPPEFALRPLIRQYLRDTPLPNFAAAETDASAQLPPLRLGLSRTDIEKIIPTERPEEAREDGEEEGKRVSEVDELLMHMSIADNGQNGHFGVASLFWESPSDAVVERLRHRTHRSEIESISGASPSSATVQGEDALSGDDSDTRDNELDAEVLKMNAAMIQGWETLAFNKLKLERDLEEANVIWHLLETYFCWQYAAHCVIYRPVFIRDLALGGPYFNEFLLQVICACAIRHADPSQVGSSTSSTMEAEYMARAKVLLSAEIDQPSSIPTIQGLLLLGQRDCAHGNLSQGWMYTGMAFRAMKDMGIHLDCSRLPIFGFGMLTVEDREIRRRLFWSAFTWDKIISLALGRTPTFNAHQTVSPGHIIDDTEDDEIWQPQAFADQGSRPILPYPPHKSYITTNFKHFIKLCEIIQTIIMRLYVGRPRHVGIGRFIQAMQARLSEWFDRFPSEIKLDARTLPEHCPPPHIFATNVLYRASWILLYRIFIPNTLPAPTGAPANLMREASAACSTKAGEIYELLKLYNKSFGPRNMTYISIWSIYSASTIDAIDFQSDDPEISTTAGSRLSMSMYILEKGIPHSPGTKRSLEILKHRLRRPRSTIKRTANSLHEALLTNSSGRRLRRPRAESTETTQSGHGMASHSATEATFKSSTDTLPVTAPELTSPKMRDPMIATPPLFSVNTDSTSGAAISSSTREQDWINTLVTPSPAQHDAQSYRNPETDDWGTLYSLLTANDTIYSTVEAVGYAGTQGRTGSQTMDPGDGMPGTLGPMDFSQGVMAVPSFVDSEHIPGVWAGFL